MSPNKVTAGIAIVSLAGAAYAVWRQRSPSSNRDERAPSSGAGLDNWRWLLWANLLVLLISGGVLGYSYLVQTLGARAKAQITRLQGPVGMVAVVRGTVERLPSNSHLWIIVRSGPSNRFYPQEGPLMPKGESWQATVVFGNRKDAGRRFDVIAVLADPVAEGVFTNYLSGATGRDDAAGLADIPNTARVLDKFEVQRRRE